MTSWLEGPVASCRCRDRPRATRREQKGLAPRRFARRTRRTRARSMAAATFSATLVTAPRDVAVRASSARAVVLARASRRHHRASRGVVVVAPSSRSTASARPTAVAAAAPAGDALPPTAVFDTVVAAAEKKAAQDPATTLLLGFSAGALIGMGALLMSCVGGASPALAASNPGLCNFLKGAVGLPAGLTLVILTGAELFTGNVMTMTSGVLAGKVDAASLARNWTLSYVGNFVGSVALAFLAFWACTAAAPAAKAAVIGIATMKATLPFAVSFFKGVLCNWLVCLAVWGTMASTSTAGKILAIFWPITAFVALGFEHSIANMFLIPHGMLCGADVTIAQMMMNNIVPVTLGNVFAAAVFVAGLHWRAYSYGGNVAAAAARVVAAAPEPAAR
ncbi:formate-nitrite transporter family [Micromonas pusilla CCMP1545]|uniref:Formate-nitrite transporter family n=1 Tax=Micromonas pusilla (strain CCMP1545) TaxID=564608 RepID=C1MRJ8_MICPC|nr:formate-nitrite transporter family [Micromonas pusilla CCMP1545]EEH58270.1 formate-nitrite transporter family [Micromonas pusilla CCMP1545]|eukprot:XP_003058319.1 formate-nitrite transporter family [Micromonas pusilla CCMP1545]